MIKEKLFNKDGNNFIGGLLIVFAGICIGTIVLTYQDFKSTKYVETPDNQLVDIEVKETALIIQEMNEEEKKFQELLLTELGKDMEHSSISSLAHYKTTIHFDALGSATILEEYMDDTLSVYLCDIDIINMENQYIRVTIDSNNILSMVLVDENGVEVDNGTINLPLMMSEQIVENINSLYKMRKGLVLE